MSKEEGDLARLPDTPKPSLLEYLETFLPFKLPRIPLPQSAKNFDKAVGRLVLATGEAGAKRIERGSRLSDAEVAAKVELIKRGSKAIGKRIADEDPDLVDRAIAAALGEQVSEQRNRERVVEVAVRELEAAPPQQDAAAEIDNDWLNLFASLASKKSREDVQSLWGKVLAGEIRQPGTFKLRTLQSLSVVEASEAHLIYKCFAFVLDGDKLFFGTKREFVSLAELLELENLGVIQAATGQLHMEIFVKPGQEARLMIGADHVLIVESGKDRKTQVGGVTILTSFGRDLSRLGGEPPPVAELAASLAGHLRAEECTVSLLRLGEQVSGGRQVLERTVL